MTTPLTLTPGRYPDGTALLKAVGEIDMSNSGALADALESAGPPAGAGVPTGTSGVVGAAQRLVLDLTDVGYLDSAGLSVLFAHAHHVELVAAPLLAPVLAISGLADLTTIHDAAPPEIQ
ncbi:STAS domain-containing protein [Streptomyces sp. NPDC091272]|uniref:STAS domain-containing protein n=1 Tax=Streptomyces sp. NPDC091272 TaxID=3365981 RepID=UPI00382D263A